jgi:hypothetical protein
MGRIFLGGRMSKSNIIDLKPFLKKQKKNSHHAKKAAPVIDMEEKREEFLSQERRDRRRTILTEFIGAFIVLPSQGPKNGGLQKVTLYDISENGVSFDMDPSVGQLRSGDELAMRIYLSQKSYFSFTIKVINTRFEKDEEVYRQGCQFLRDSLNKDALFYFVKFVEAVTLNMKTDLGDLLTHSSKR